MTHGFAFNVFFFTFFFFKSHLYLVKNLMSFPECSGRIFVVKKPQLIKSRMKSDIGECYGTQLPQILHKDISMNIERRRKLTLMLNYTNQIYTVMLEWLRR